MRKQGRDIPSFLTASEPQVPKAYVEENNSNKSNSHRSEKNEKAFLENNGSYSRDNKNSLNKKKESNSNSFKFHEIFPNDKKVSETLVSKIPENISKARVANDKRNPRETEHNQKIAITSFIRSNCVYIRDADEETTKRYNMIHHVVGQLSKNLSPIQSLPEEGTFAIVKFNGFKRCTIQSVKGENKIKVFLSDIGQQEVVQMNQLFEPGERLEKLASTSFIKMMKLESVPEFYLNRKAAEYARSLLRDDIFLELHQGSDPEKGRIFDVVNNEFINDVLFCYGQEEQEEETFQELEPEDKEFTHVQEEIFKFEVSFINILQDLTIKFIFLRIFEKRNFLSKMKLLL